MVGCVSSHFFPCDGHHTSKVATMALVVVVVSAVLLSIAFAKGWGAAAYGTFGGLTGLFVVVLGATIRSRKIAQEEERVQVEKADRAAHLKESANTLYDLAMKNNLPKFKQTLAEYDQRTLASLWKTTTDYNKDGFSWGLFKFLLEAPEIEQERIAFLTALLEAFDDRSFHAHDFVYEPLLAIPPDKRLMQLVIEKFDEGSLHNLFARITFKLRVTYDQSSADIYSGWLDVIDKLPKESSTRQSLARCAEVRRKGCVQDIQKASKLAPAAKTRYCALFS